MARAPPMAGSPNCCMASLPVAISAAKMPRTEIMAMRPLFSSFILISSLYMFTPKGVAVIARLFLRVLPPPQLQWGASEEDAEEAEHALALVHDGEARGSILEERELDEMLCDEPDRSHHRYSTMLDLGDTQLPKALLVAHLGEPEWIKESKRLGGAELLGRLEERRCILLNDGLSPSHHALCSHDS